jgi:hypothetical protein
VAVKQLGVMKDADQQFMTSGRPRSCAFLGLRTGNPGSFMPFRQELKSKYKPWPVPILHMESDMMGVVS